MTDATTGLLVTTISTLIMSIVKMVLDYKSRNADREDRRLIAEELRSHIVENTDLTKEAITKSEIAINTSNNISEKIYATGLTLRGDKQRSTDETDTNAKSRRS